jgi:hypothetical protein
LWDSPTLSLLARAYGREADRQNPSHIKQELDDGIIFAKQKTTSAATVCPESKTSSLSSIANVESKLIAVGTKDRPPTNMEEKRKQVEKRRAFENKKKERANRIQALISKAQEHQVHVWTVCET